MAQSDAVGGDSMGTANVSFSVSNGVSPPHSATIDRIIDGISP